MKKVFAFGIAVAIFIASVFAVGLNVTPVGTPQDDATLEQLATEMLTEEYPDHTIDNVDVISVEKDDVYGGYRVAIVYSFDGYEAYTAMSLNSFQG